MDCLEQLSCELIVIELSFYVYNPQRRIAHIMSKRNFTSWLDAFLDYSSSSEAPMEMLFWSGVSAIAGALQRKVYLDMGNFKWYPNHYIVLVAPPGIVSKTTTANAAHNLLREIPGIKFGPDVITWQALATRFAEITEEYLDPNTGEFTKQSAMTIVSDEMGNLIDLRNPEMVNLYISLWDSKTGIFEKNTKASGNDAIANPWINMIACTTPSWIEGNFPEYMIGGGFTSRCVFIYENTKRKHIAYPFRHFRDNHHGIRKALVEDLVAITSLCGEFHLTPDAIDYGEKWYTKHYEEIAHGADNDRLGGYKARKQTHIHKLAMVLSASEGDDLRITQNQLERAVGYVSGTEATLAKVFDLIGRSEAAQITQDVLKVVTAMNEISVVELKAVMLSKYDSSETDKGIQGLIAAGKVGIKQGADGFPTVYPRRAQGVSAQSIAVDVRD